MAPCQAAQGQGAHLAAGLLERRARQIQDRHLRALGLESLRRGPADRAGPAGHRHHVAGERGLLALAELGLLQGPVLDVEELRVAKTGEMADRFRLGDHLDGGLRQVRDDPGVLGALAGGEESDPRHQEHPRHGIERLFGAAQAGVVTCEVGAIALDVVLHRPSGRLGEAVQIAGLRRRQNQRTEGTGGGLD